MNHPKETPLLMAGELVRATLARLKTETRRPLKPQPMRTLNQHRADGILR